MQYLKTWGVMAVAVLLAGLAGLGTMQYLDGRERMLRQAMQEAYGPIYDIVVAKRDVAPGEIIDLDNMEIGEFPAQFIAQDAIPPTEFGSVAGASVRIPLAAGRPLLRSYVSGMGMVDTFSELLVEGQRALTLQIDELNSHAGMLEVGDFIDLVVALERDDEDEAETETIPNVVTLLERVRVLATGRKTLAEAGMEYPSPHFQQAYSYSSITLGVPVPRVSDVIAAKEKGNLFMLLRNPRDEGRAQYRSSIFDTTVGEKGAIEVYSGSVDKNGVLQAVKAPKGTSGLIPVFSSRNEHRLNQKFKPAPSTPAPVLARE